MKIIKIFKAAFITLFCFYFTSCAMDEIMDGQIFSDKHQMLPVKSSYYDRSEYELLPFAKALYSAMKESPELRELIKSESLKKFDKEYEFLYQFIKDETVENGLTVRELLLKNYKGEKSLPEIEDLHPALTILIPILPKESFSAEIWNVKEQIPAVAIHSPVNLNPFIVSEKGKFLKNSEEFMIEPGRVPAFPVIVIKDNERVVVSQNENSKYQSLNKRSSDYVFDFIDDCYDGSVKDENAEIETRSYWGGSTIDQKLIDAYNIYGANSGWQRDYIYYNITNSVTSGTLSQNFRETILAFQFNPSYNPQQVCSYIMNSPSTDPQFPWTSGQFNFRVEALLAAKNGNAPTITKYFFAYPLDLFDVTFVYKNGTYIPTFNGFRKITLNIPLLNWNLADYGTVMKISVWKLSPSGTYTINSSFTSTVADNVKYYDKDGKEYGSTTTTTQHTSSYTAVYQVSDVHLGDFLYTFGEPVILSSRPTGYPHPLPQTVWELMDWNAGVYIFNIIPMK